MSPKPVAALLGLAYAFIAIPHLAVVLVAATPPDLTILCDQAPEICTNMCWAVRCADPSFSQFLTFDFPNRTTLGHRRRAACGSGRGGMCSADDGNGRGGRRRRQQEGYRGPPYTSCNEYPFASTSDAADAQHVVTRCVPASEQKYQQARVSALQRRWKDEGKTSFLINFGNPGGVRYCNNDACTNDGFEVQQHGGGGGGREEAKRVAAKGPLFRYYRTSAGTVLATMGHMDLRSNFTREMAPGETLDASFDSWTEHVHVDVDVDMHDGEMRMVQDTIVQELPWDHFQSHPETAA
ncbi:hypothetical protein E4U21_006069 [Claviceps maximensis]|nr:hypothetical protein E4U21_006069 [Claviceps maximensis]